MGPARLRSFVMIHFEANLRSARRRAARRPLLDHRARRDRHLRRARHRLDLGLHAPLGSRARVGRIDYDEAAVQRDRAARARHRRDFAFTIRTIRTWHDDRRRSPSATARAASSWSATRRTAFRRPAGSASTPACRTRTTSSGSSAAVRAGWAPASLLDSYEARAPAGGARRTPTSARANAARMLEVYQALGGGAGDGAEQDGYAPPSRHQAEHFDMLGLQLGFRYEAGALVPDGSGASGRREPRARVRPERPPGRAASARLVSRDGAAASRRSISCAHDRFTLITGAGGRGVGRSRRGDRVAAAAHARDRRGDVADDGGAWARTARHRAGRRAAGATRSARRLARGAPAPATRAPRSGRPARILGR